MISIIVPVYNTAPYLPQCLDSLVNQTYRDIEIICVNDGSTDNSPDILKAYAERDSRILVIHQENLGLSGARNKGLESARGEWVMFVDSDDWLNEEALKKALEVLKLCVRGPKTLDLLICNYVYEKVGAKRKTVMRYRSALPQDKIFGWDDVKPLGTSHYLLMHSMIYRTELLWECGLKLPEHTFYVDNLVAFIPLASVQSMYYLDVNFYRYFIGRDDQSVNEKVMIKRIDQQIRVNKLMVDAYLKANVSNRRLRAYMFSYLDIITTVSSIMLVRAATQECLDKKQELQDYIKDQNMGLYRKLRRSLFGRVSNLPGRGGRKMFVAAYKICQKFYGFN